MKGDFRKANFFPEIFSKGCMNNRAPPLTLFNIFNGERGYIGWGYVGGPPYVFHVKQKVN